MAELPRSRALVRLDGPGHIMPVEPVTPPDSTAWRLLHLPVVLAMLALGLLAVAALAIRVAALGFQSLGHLLVARYLVPVIGATAVVAGYWLFVRYVERRPDVEELGGEGWLAEFGLGAGGGLLLSFATFAVLTLAGALEVVGFNAASGMLLPLVVQLCTAAILEIIVCGIGFRLIERWLGSWLALLAIMVFFGAVGSLADDAEPLGVLAVALEAGLLFAVLYIVTRRLWAAIGLNAAWKVAQIGFYGLDATVTGRPRGFVLAVLSGPDWLTGGRSGTDASIPGLAVNALLIVALLVTAVRLGRIVRPVWRRGRVA